MAGSVSPITDAHGWHIGEDRRLVIHVKNSAGVPVDVSGFALSWMLKRYVTDLDAAALLTKTTAGGSPPVTIAGTYNADPDVNEQRVYVAIADIDTDGMRPFVYKHELKRTDAGSEGLLIRPSSAKLQQGVHRS